MKLSKIYLLKKFKSDEIISFKFPFINNRYHKMTRRVANSPTRRVGESLREKDSIKIVFSHTEVVISPPKFAKKYHFLPNNVRWIYRKFIGKKFRPIISMKR